MRSRAFGMMLVAAFAMGAAAKSQTCSVRNLIVDVVDKQGRPIPKLVPSDFRAYSGKRPLNVQSAAFYKAPSARRVVLLDTSGSMRGRLGHDKWKIARGAALAFVSSTPDEAPISLVTFSEAIQDRFDSAGGRQAIRDWLNSAETRDAKQVKGKTGLYSSILEVLKSLAPAHLGDSIYLITDGGDNASHANTSQVARELQANGVRLFAFLFNDKVGRSDNLHEGELYSLARSSGGMAFNMNEQSGPGLNGSVAWYSYDSSVGLIDQTAHWAQNAIDYFYLLTVDVGNHASASKPWRIEVVDAQRDKKRDTLLAYPERPLACSNSPAEP